MVLIPKTEYDSLLERADHIHEKVPKEEHSIDRETKKEEIEKGGATSLAAINVVPTPVMKNKPNHKQKRVRAKERKKGIQKKAKAKRRKKKQSTLPYTLW